MPQCLRIAAGPVACGRWQRDASHRKVNRMDNHSAHEDSLNKGSITLLGGVAMGTGVMIGAGIFALTGQIAELAGPLFPLSFAQVRLLYHEALHRQFGKLQAGLQPAQGVRRSTDRRAR